MDDPDNEGADRKVWMRFPDGDRPGTYELRATYRRSYKSSDRAWDGEHLSSPPIRIVLE